VILPSGALVVLVGAPAAGKSTLAAALVAAGEVEADDVLSTDTYREVLTGDALDLTSDRKVWVQVRERLDEKMAAGRTTVVDATNLFARRRARHIRVARDHGRPVVAIRFDVPAAELLERNENRPWVVRPNVVVTMAVEMEEHGGPETLAAEVDLVLDAEEVRRRINDSGDKTPRR
jgi:predicted kinase